MAQNLGSGCLKFKSVSVTPISCIRIIIIMIIIIIIMIVIIINDF